MKHDETLVPTPAEDHMDTQNHWVGLLPRKPRKITGGTTSQCGGVVKGPRVETCLWGRDRPSRRDRRANVARARCMSPNL